jgi:hypothetical protein
LQGLSEYEIYLVSLDGSKCDCSEGFIAAWTAMLCSIHVQALEGHIVREAAASWSKCLPGLVRLLLVNLIVPPYFDPAEKTSSLGSLAADRTQSTGKPAHISCTEAAFSFCSAP